MQKSGLPTATQCQATYDTITPPGLTGTTARLTWRNLVDFVPGKAPYHTNMAVDLLTEAEAVLLRLTFDPMHDPVWTERQRMGWDLELGKLQTVLGSR